MIWSLFLVLSCLLINTWNIFRLCITVDSFFWCRIKKLYRKLWKYYYFSPNCTCNHDIGCHFGIRIYLEQNDFITNFELQLNLNWIVIEFWIYYEYILYYISICIIAWEWFIFINIIFNWWMILKYRKFHKILFLRDINIYDFGFIFSIL